jgi:hypothetical protein
MEETKREVSTLFGSSEKEVLLCRPPGCSESCSQGERAEDSSCDVSGAVRSCGGPELFFFM